MLISHRQPNWKGEVVLISSLSDIAELTEKHGDMVRRGALRLTMRNADFGLVSTSVIFDVAEISETQSGQFDVLIFSTKDVPHFEPDILEAIRAAYPNTQIGDAFDEDMADEAHYFMMNANRSLHHVLQGGRLFLS